MIGFEPWEDFPFNRGMLCPKGVKRYLQGSHPDRLLTAYRARSNCDGRIRPMAYDEAIRTSPMRSSASKRSTATRLCRAQRRQPDDGKNLPDGQVRPHVF